MSRVAARAGAGRFRYGAVALLAAGVAVFALVDP